LFGDDVNAYLKDRITDFAFLISFTDEAIRESPEQQQSILIDKKFKAMTKIAEYQVEAPRFSTRI
jgi:hypothetical protein